MEVIFNMKHYFTMLFLLSSLVLFGCTKQSESAGCIFSNDPNTIKVCTTLFPQYDFAKQIGGNLVEVSLLLKPGTDPHSFDPTPQDMIRLNQSDVFIYTNELMEPWVANVKQAIENKNLVILNASKQITLLETNHDHDHGEHNHDEEDHDHHLDPHVWTSITNATIMIDTIKDVLIDLKPDHRETFERNAETYKNRLFELDQQFHELFSNLNNRTIIHGGHFALGYFAHDYDLNIITVFESYSSNEEVTGKNIIELIKVVKETGIETIYQEELIDSQTVRVIKEELDKDGHDVEIKILHGLHNVTSKELANGVTYYDLMAQNYLNLKEGLMNHD